MALPTVTQAPPCKVVVVVYRSNEASPRVSHQVQAVDNRILRERMPPRRAAECICAWVSRLEEIAQLCREEKHEGRVQPVMDWGNKVRSS